MTILNSSESCPHLFRTGSGLHRIRPGSGSTPLWIQGECADGARREQACAEPPCAVITHHGCSHVLRVALQRHHHRDSQRNGHLKQREARRTSECKLLLRHVAHRGRNKRRERHATGHPAEHLSRENMRPVVRRRADAQRPLRERHGRQRRADTAHSAVPEPIGIATGEWRHKPRDHGGGSDREAGPERCVVPDRHEKRRYQNHKAGERHRVETLPNDGRRERTNT